MSHKDKNGNYYKNNKSIKEILLPIGHCSIINSNYEKSSTLPIISIYGLGSCIALILYDKANNVAGMSHILLPKSRLEGLQQNPHKYADTSVHHLFNDLIKHGAEKRNIKAIIVGGSNIFNNPGCAVGELNIRSVKKALTDLEIKIVKKNLGGTSGRLVKFFTRDYSVKVRLTGEDEFKLI